MYTWWKKLTTDKTGKVRQSESGWRSLIGKVRQSESGWRSLRRIGLDGLLGFVFLFVSLSIAFQVARIKIAESASSYSIINQTTHNGTGDTPNAGGFNNGTKTNTTVSGTGVSASVQLSGSGAWSTATIDSTGSVGSYNSISVVDANTIFVSYYDATNGDLKFAKSTNGGTTWTTATIDSTNTSGSYNSIHAVDANTIFVSYKSVTIGSCWDDCTSTWYSCNTDPQIKFAKSTNGGTTWTTTTLRALESDYAAQTSIDAVDANNIFISQGNEGTAALWFYKSTNGGTSWGMLSTPSGGFVVRSKNSIDAVDANTIFISYYDHNYDLRYAKSTNGGSTWTCAVVDSNANFVGNYNSIHAVDANTVFISYYDGPGNERIKFAKSTDGGTTWTTKWIYSPNTPECYGTSIDATDANTIFVSYIHASSSCADTCTVYNFNLAKSTDGGTTWTTSTILYGTDIGVYYPSLDVSDSNNLFVSYYNDGIADLKFAKSSLSAAPYYSTGTIESATIDLGAGAQGALQLGSLRWSSTTPSQIRPDYDLIIGVYEGAACLAYENTGSATSPTWAAKPAWNVSISWSYGGNPTFADLDADGDYDLLINDNSSNGYAYENTGSATSPTWAAKPAWAPPSGVGPDLGIADLDADGDYDLLIGDTSGNGYAYENTGSATSPTWTRKSAWDGGGKKPTFADLDADGDYDMFKVGGGSDYNCYAYKNTGSTTSPVWTQWSAWDPPQSLSNISNPVFADLDADGDYDLLIGTNSGIVYAYENTGSATSPTWTRKSAWDTPDVGSNSSPAIANLDSTPPIRLQLATRADTNFTSTDYKGLAGTTNSYFTNSSDTAIPSSFDNNRYLRYKAFLSTSNTAYTPSLNDIVITVVPDTPTGVTIAEPTSLSQLVVNWNSQGDATSYYVKRSYNGTSWSTAVDSSGLTTYTDSSLSNNTKYYYQVAAYNAGGTSSYTIASPVSGYRYTLSPSPSISEASSPQKSASTWYNTGFSFQNALSWSTGGIDSYRYYWTTASSFSWTTTGTTTWTTGTITPTISSPNSYYLYARSYNGDSVETATTWSSGPWRYETAAPIAFDLSGPASNTWTSSLTPTLAWDASSDADSSLAKYKLYVGGSLNKDNISSASTWTTANTLITEGDYSWSVVAVDNAGNSRTSTSSRIIRIDRTAPGAYSNTLAEVTGTAYQYPSGTTLYYNPASAGSFSVSCSSSPTDSGSGVQKVNFPSLGAGFTGGGDDSSSPYSVTYTFDVTATTGPGAQVTTAYDNVGWTTASAFTITKDTTAPVSGAISYTDGFNTSAPSITLTRGTDATSGIDSSRGVLEYAREIYDGSSTPDFTSSTWTILSSSNPSSPYTDNDITLGYAYRYRYTTYDNVSNSAVWTSGNTVLCGLRITAPNGAEQYEIEGTKNITWSAFSIASSIDIYYSTTDPVSWTYCLDTNDIPADDIPTGTNWTFSWKLPTTVSDTVKVRLVGPNSTADTSDNYFYLAPHPAITIKAPTAASSWRIGDLQSIQWSSNYSVNNEATVWYRPNGSTTWTTILETSGTVDDGIVANTRPASLSGTYANSINWTIPDTAGTSTEAQVRITYNSRSELSPATNWTATSVNFSITGPSISIDTPSDAPWKVRQLKTITWTTTGAKSANVSLYYSTNGTAWTLFDASQPTSNDGSYGWTVIDGAVSGNTQLKVADLGWTLTSETTPFVVRRPTIEVTAPNTDSLTLIAGDAYSIQWSSEPPVKAGSGNGTVKLQVSTTGAAGTYSDISGATSLANASGSNSWTWTTDSSLETTQGRIKVIDNELTDITDASNYNFTIRYPAINLATFPAAGEPTDTDGVTALVVGDGRAITWTTERNFSNNLIIECLVGASVAWSVGDLQTNNYYTHPNGSYTWTIPSAAEGSSVQIRIKDSTRPTILATSSTFKVLASPKYKLIRPNSTNEAGANYVIAKKVYYSNAPTNTQGITWTSIGDSASSATPLKIAYTTDNGITWSMVTSVAGTTNDGNYEIWNVPFEAVSSNTKLRVWKDTNSDNQPDTGEMQGDSDAFRVVSSITINQPTAGTTWTVGTSNNTISWSTIGAITQVKAEYYNGTSWTTLNSAITNTDATGTYNNNYSTSYSWTIPNENAYLAASGQLKITGTSPFGATAVFHTIGISVVAPRFDTFTITSPSADSGYYVGDTATLNWTWTGGLAGPQEIAYSSNGTAWTVCTGASALANSVSTFGWTILSDAVGSGIRLRVRDTDSNRSTSTKDTSTFQVLTRPTITITSPTVTPDWRVGKGYAISWSSTGGIHNNVLLECSLDDTATSWTTIASAQNASNTSGYTWTVLEAVLPDADSASRQIRISDTTRSDSVALADASWTAAFTAVKPLITINAPANGAYWTIGTTPQITWSVDGGKTAGTVDIYCDTDHGAGTTWSLIGNDVSYTPNTSTSWTWTVVNDVGATGIKIAETSRPNYTWTAIGDFYVIGALTLLTPSATGIGLVATDTYGITWTTSGTAATIPVANTELYYSTNNWTTSTQIVFGTNATTPVYSGGVWTSTWTVPNSPSNNVKMRVRDSRYPTVAYDDSNNAFAIGGTPYLTIIQPAQGVSTSWTVGTGSHAIQWTGSSNVNDNISVYYKTSTGSWTLMSGASGQSKDGSYSWTVPQAALASGASDTAQIRVRDETRTQTAMTWTPSITVTAPGISVADPSAGSNYVVVSEVKALSWTTDGEVAAVDVYYDQDQTAATSWSLISNDVSNTSNGSTTWSWTVPNDVGPTSIKVEDISRTAYSYGTSTSFTICGKFTAVGRSASEVTAGQALTISWTTTGQIDQSNIQLLYYRNDAGFDSTTYPAQTISSSDLGSWNIGASTGSVVWTVPTTVGGNYVNQDLQIRVRDSRVSSNANSYEDTTSTFKIKGDFAVTSPSAGNNWTIDAGKAITWNTTGNVSSVKLYYTTNASAGTPTWTILDSSSNWSIAANANTSTSWTWTVADNISSDCKVKVVDANDATVSASSGTFNIKGTVDLKSPDTNVSWIIGKPYAVTWSVTAGDESITSIKLQYSTESGNTGTWKDMASGTLGEVTTVATSGSTGSYTWTIPIAEANTTNARVRIYEASSLSNTDMSSVNFAIASPTITVTQPGLAQRGSNSLVVNEPYDIKWTTNGTVSTVKIEASYNNQSSWTVVAWTVGNVSPYTYTWTPTSSIETGAWIKITDLSTTHTGNSGYSDDAFSVLPTPALTLRNPTATWIAGKNYAIEWTATSQALLGHVTLWYSLNGSTWWTIDTNQPNTDAVPTSSIYYSYSWTLPDFYSAEPYLTENDTSVQLKITDATRNTSDTSENFTIAIPTITVSQPNGSEYWAVGDTAQIKWTYQGALAGDLTLQCDKTAGTSFGPDIIWSVSSINKTGGTTGDGTYAYTWTIPSSPDVTGTAVKFKVLDIQRQNSNDTSDAVFNIISAPEGTMTAPTSSSHFYADETWTVSWTIHGLIGKDTSGNNNLIIQYSDNNFASNIWSVASGVSRGTTQVSGEADSGNYVGTYAWAIPGGAHTSNTMKIRVFDPARSIYWTSAAFPLTGGFAFRDPADSSVTWSLDVASNSDTSQTLWTAGTGRTIYWYNKGTHDTVKLQYLVSTNGTTWTTANYTNIAASIDNSGTGTVYNSSTGISTYSWTVVDPESANYPQGTDPNSAQGYYYAKFKLIDADPATMGTEYEISKESPIFKITYYQIKFAITNEYNNIVSSVMNFRDTTWSVANVTATVEADATTFQHKYPYGAYTTLISGGSGTDYGNFQVSWTANANQTVSKKIYSNTYLQTEWETKANFFYDEDNDAMKVNSWLERRKSPLSQDADLGVGGDAYIKVYSSTAPEDVLWTLTDSTADTNGNYWFDWTTTGLTAGVSYFAKCGVYYSGDLHENKIPFSVTISKKLSELATQIDTKTAAIQDKANATWTLANVISGQTSVIETKVGDVKTAVETTIPTSITAVKTDTGKVLTATESTIPSKIETERAKVTAELTSKVEPQVASGILNRDTLVKQGDTVTIRYRTTTGLSPTITVYDPSNVVKISAAIMTEVGTSGVYEYDVTFETSWDRGDYTVVVSESTKGTVDAMTMTVSTADIEDVSTSVASILGTVVPIRDIKTKVDAFTAAFNVIEENISKAAKALAGAKTGTEGAVEATNRLTSLYKSLKEMSTKINELGGTIGLNLDKMYEVAEARAKDIGYIRNKTQELKALMELNQQMIENAAKEEPAITTWFEYK